MGASTLFGSYGEKRSHPLLYFLTSALGTGELALLIFRQCTRKLKGLVAFLAGKLIDRHVLPPLVSIGALFYQTLSL
jgi:hypothetical protein